MKKSYTATNVNEYLNQLTESRKVEIEKLIKMISKQMPSEKVFIMNGFISWVPYHYRYKSGREGDWMLIALASQKNYISVYVCMAKNGKYLAEENKDKLKGASIGKSCIRFKDTSKINLDNLMNVVRQAYKLYKKNPNFAKI